MKIALLLPAVLIGLVSGIAAAAEDNPKPAAVDFNRDVRPILVERCFRCHGADKREGGLRLTNLRDALTAADSGAAVIVPGQSAKSVLIERVTSIDENVQMPPEGARLTEVQVNLLKTWIDRGAVWPEEAPAARHWAYVPPVRPQRPTVRDADWPRTEIDYQVLARLDREGLKPSPEADRAQLIRRLSLDLIGLPPTPAEVTAFLADDRPTAYESLVDRLLASPQYGERWARPWLDLARYADSNGFQRDGFRDLWAYRDWVVRAMNADMPFDRFTLEQIAGDLLPDATLDQQTATGFHRCTTVNVEAGTDQEENRVNQVIDRVNTTGTVWLGTTIECAQCHNHKYDPVTQRDYYRLLAFFNNTEIETKFRTANATAAVDFTGPAIELPNPSTREQTAKLQEQLTSVETQIAAAGKQLDGERTDWERTLVEGGGAAAVWHALEVAEFKSSGGAEGKVLDDRSVLVGGEEPEKDTYIVTVWTKLTGISGFKLEALTDPSLPGEGPGRGDEERPNFIVNRFSVTMAKSSDESPRPVRLHSARADFSQKSWDVAGAIDDDPKTGWAINPQFHKPHEASFLTDEPLVNESSGEQGSDAVCVLTFRIEQNYGGGRTIGRLRLSALTGNRDTETVPAEILAVVKKPAAERSKADRKRLDDYRLSQHPALKRLTAQRDRLQQELKDIESPQTLVMKELSQPRMTNVFLRGNFLDRGQDVSPGTPDFLHALPPGPANRLTLARWLASRDNPLVARVAVNRWWAEFFGQGLVTTPEDFGIKGETPTHPELLDLLAVEFMDGGWSMKRLHRLIVTSAVYRQSSRVTPELLARDDRNKLLARGPRFRLEAEMIRDNALAIAGLLSLKQGGPPVKPYQPEGLWRVTGLVDNTYKVSEGEDQYRRGLYVVWRRSAPYPSFMNFDAQIRAACVVKRSRSNTPLQALTLLNDPVYVEAEMALARRMTNEVTSSDVDERIGHGFRLTLARSPSDRELSALRQLHAAALARYEASPKESQQLTKGQRLPSDATASEFAAWYEVAAVLLNLDETITKN